ncbi:MAG TPA: TfoX/Sxy family protein [Vicinamibacterales bacterium]|jgi:DNA transformation protein|nr:TfoX/Sxy family protein [Vicinamibacterales bacterium]
MPVTDGFVEFVLEQLEPVGPITPRRMFGGVGLYAGDLFFALLACDVLYLKADDSTRRELEAAGARPFQPYPDRGIGTMQYYSVPAAILEDSDELIAWARKSVAVSRAQRTSPPARRRRMTPKPSRQRTRRRPR